MPTNSIQSISLRGMRPSLRGWIHLTATAAFAIAGTVLAIFAATWQPPAQTLATVVYVLSVVSLFGISAAYHRGQWKTTATIERWRRADHSMIAIFIAATYTPLCAILLPQPQQAIILTAAWAAAGLIIVLNTLWLNHPRWLASLCYIIQGWLIIPVIPTLYHQGGITVLTLLAAGGVVYTLGAIGYACKWPGKTAKHWGYHEYFHAATVVAAILHYVAIWLVISR